MHYRGAGPFAPCFLKMLIRQVNVCIGSLVEFLVSVFGHRFLDPNVRRSQRSVDGEVSHRTAPNHCLCVGIELD